MLLLQYLSDGHLHGIWLVEEVKRLKLSDYLNLISDPVATPQVISRPFPSSLDPRCKDNYQQE